MGTQGLVESRLCRDRHCPREELKVVSAGRNEEAVRKRSKDTSANIHGALAENVCRCYITILNKQLYLVRLTEAKPWWCI